MWILIRIIDVVGYSGSGKTSFITSAIKLLKEKLNYNVAVIKNVKHHPVDQKGKDSYEFIEAGAKFSVIQNDHNETAIFMKTEEGKLQELLKWLMNGPFKLDLIFTEGFRNLHNPTVLCISNINEIEGQLTENVKIVSGVISSKKSIKDKISDLPIVDIESQFSLFLNLFKIP